MLALSSQIALALPDQIESHLNTACRGVEQPIVALYLSRREGPRYCRRRTSEGRPMNRRVARRQMMARRELCQEVACSVKLDSPRTSGCRLHQLIVSHQATR